MDKQAKGNCILPPPILGKINKLCLFVALLLVAAACDDKYDDTALWDKVNDHEERIAALEEWQEQTNQSIAGIQELLNTTDMITAVTTLTEGGDTLGYTISFRHGDPITIYNGAKGEPGADGQTPRIGLTRADDGNWYWTLNGETLADDQGNPIRANGIDGQDGQDGQDGADGSDGQDGAPGQQGPQGPEGPAGTSAPTPRISLGSSITSGTIMTDNGLTDDDAWYLSVDGGATWYRVSGKDGTNGTDGDAWFSDAPKKEGNYYVFTLTDQSTFEVAAYQPIRILTEEEENEDDSNFDNATVLLSGKTTFYLHVEDNIDYQSIVAQVTPVEADAVLTRAGGWSATVAKNGTDITVTVTPDQAGFALLDVSLIRTDGSKLTASRLLDYGYTLDQSSNTATVYTANGLRTVAALVNNDGQTGLNITLANDIDLAGEAWTPIGPDYYRSYTGTFDGGGHTIKGLKVTGDFQYAGLIGYLWYGKVKDVAVEDVDITTSHSPGYAGGVVGCSDNGTVMACHSSGTITGSKHAGGVVGYFKEYSIIIACYSTGDVTATGAEGSAGGLTGSGKQENGGSSSIRCTACYHATGTVMGTYAGGLIGGGILEIVDPYGLYWSSVGPTSGYGEYNPSNFIKVDGTTVTWADAVIGMNDGFDVWNEIHPDKPCYWKYELLEGNDLPTLVKRQEP